MQLRWLTAFVTVAEELNYRRAVERLHVAQPAISQQIMNLQRDLGVKLFDRNNRSVQLTDAGDAFLAPCRSALSALENAGLSARNAGTGEYGKIRLGFNAGFTPTIWSRSSKFSAVNTPTSSAPSTPPGVPRTS